MALIAQIDVTVTHTETEALLLEHNYIKLYQPRYNVLLRDDKSYPFIFLSGDTHPRLATHRGAKHAKGEYFGPFPNGYAVRETLALLQKFSQSVNVRTAYTATARVHACSTRLVAVWGRVSPGWSARKSTLSRLITCACSLRVRTIRC